MVFRIDNYTDIMRSETNKKQNNKYTNCLLIYCSLLIIAVLIMFKQGCYLDNIVDQRLLYVLRCVVSDFALL